MRPIVARLAAQTFSRRQTLGRHGNIRVIMQNHLRDLRRRALQQRQAHIGVFFAEFSNDARQHITRLRVRGRNREPSKHWVFALRHQVFEVIHFMQDAFQLRQ